MNKSLFLLAINNATANNVYSISGVVLVVGAILTLVGTVGAIWSGGIRERLADERIAKSEETAASANADAGHANERAAGLEKDAAEARLELERLKQEMAPRAITSEQRQKFLKLLENVPKGEIPIFRGDASVETANYINQVRELLDAAGYAVNGRGVVPIIGLSVSSSEPTAEFLFYLDEHDLPDYALPVQNAFMAIGVNLLAMHYDNSGNGQLAPKQIAICIANRH